MSDGVVTVPRGAVLMPLRGGVLTPLRGATGRIAVALHVGEFVIGAPMALLAAVPPVDLRWLVPVIVLFGAWVAVYTRVALTHGLIAPLVAGDVAITVALCLLHSHIGPLARVDEGSGWVATIASLCVITVAVAWRPRAAIAAGVLVVAAFLAGFRLAGMPEKGHNHAVIMIVQLLCTVAVMGVFRRASVAADVALTAAHETSRVAAIDAARRADESTQLRLLHDTALTTLTLVGTGAVTSASAALRARAATDLAVIERLAADVPTTQEHLLVRLDEALAAIAHDPPAGLVVAYTPTPTLVPAFVAEALAGSVGEALRNTVRHADVTMAEVSVSTRDSRVQVEVADAGRGFDPTHTHAYRYGVRESIRGRMAAVGGAASVASASGVGTRWLLEWPAGQDEEGAPANEVALAGESTPGAEDGP